MIRKYFRKVKQTCWELIDKEYPEKRDKIDIARHLLYDSAKNSRKAKVTLLDAGCGHKSRLILTGHNISYIGTDMLFDDVRRNKEITYGFISDLKRIPLREASVDIVVSDMVFEHLIKPEVVFREFSRILKNGGYLIFITPNIYGIVTVINRIIPDVLSSKLSNILTGKDERDIFPTKYKANSIKKLRRLLGENNFVEKDLIMFQPPPYAFVFSLLVCKMIIRYYSIINKYDWLKYFRGVIIGGYRKKNLPRKGRCHQH